MGQVPAVTGGAGEERDDECATSGHRRKRRAPDDS